MPELPEVETVRRGLEKLILGKKISSVEIRYPKMIKTDLDEFRKEVPGQLIESIGRRGKYLLFYLTDKVHIRATIMVERDSQKGIIIGKGGAMLKKIGSMARRDIELMLGDKVFLETWVKVKKNWRDKKLDLADFGYNEKEY